MEKVTRIQLARLTVIAALTPLIAASAQRPASAPAHGRGRV